MRSKPKSVPSSGVVKILERQAGATLPSQGKSPSPTSQAVLDMINAAALRDARDHPGRIRLPPSKSRILLATEPRRRMDGADSQERVDGR